MAIYNFDGIKLNKAYDVNSVSLLDVYDREKNRIGVEEEKQPGIFRDEAKITVLGNISANGTKQGGATDGTYIYQTSGDTANYTYMNLVKFKISDKTSTSVHYDGDPNFGHANDMIYNPNTGYLYITRQLQDGSITVVDSSDLSYVDTIYIEDESGNTTSETWQGCYDRTRNCYYMNFKSHICTYDENWNYVSRTKTLIYPFSFTNQSAETDGTYYYVLAHNPNAVLVFTLDADFVATIWLPTADEAEGLMYDWNGNFYLTKYASTNNVLKVVLFNS